MDPIVEPWYLNKMVWLNGFLSLSGVLTLVADTLNKTPELTVPGILMLVVGVIGLIIRIWFTTTVTPQSAARLSMKMKSRLNNFKP